MCDNTTNNNTFNHGLACILVATAKELLNNGLESLVNESITDATTPLSMTKAIAKVLLKQRSHLMDSIRQLISKRNCSSDCHQYLNQNVCGHAFIDDNLTSKDCADLISCTIEMGQYGRMLVCSCGNGPNHTFIREFPYAAVLMSHCHCCDGPLLVEHITLAWAITLAQRSSWQLMKNERFSALLHNVQSGAQHLTKHSNNHDNWSLHTQCLMAVTSCLCVMYSDPSNGNNVINTSTSQSDPLSQLSFNITSYVAECVMMMEVLTRLPANTHAITRITSSPSHSHSHSSTSSDCTHTGLKSNNAGSKQSKARAMEARELVEIRQDRLGLALYLSASAVNHSCRPNAAIRFTFLTPISSISTSSTSSTSSSTAASAALQQLSGACIEVVVSQGSIGRGHELTVSYGPLVGAHALSSRRAALASQYLFHCTCHACAAEEIEQRLTGQSLAGTSSDSEGSGQSVHVVNSIHLCRELERLQLEVNVLNVEITELLNVVHQEEYRSKTQQTAGQTTDLSLTGQQLLAAFERARVMTVTSSLRALGKRHFGNEMKRWQDTASSVSSSSSLQVMSGMSSPPAALHMPAPEKDLYVQYCGLLCCALDIHARVQAQSGRYSAAAATVEEAIYFLVDSSTFHDTDVAVSRERVKLAQLYLSAGEFSKSRCLVKRVLVELQPCVSSDDPDWTDLLCMHKFLMKKFNKSKLKL